MPRIRTVKPQLAKHELLFDAEIETGLPLRFAWAMLFTVCDREGRFHWRPRELKTDILPYDELDFSRVLDAWLTRGLLVKYRVGDEWYGHIPTWRRHQVINNRESASQLPDPSDYDEIYQQDIDTCGTRGARVLSTHKGKGREGKGKEGEKERKGKEGIAATAAGAESENPPPAPSPVFIRMPLAKNGDEAEVTETMIDDWVEAYPGVDIRQQLRNMRQWCINNPSQCKTSRGIGRFIVAWLAKEQNRGRSGGAPPVREGPIDQMKRLRREG